MPRLAYADDDGGEITQAIKERRGGALTPLDRILLHNPAIAQGWNTLFRAVRTQTTLPADVRELAILRVAALNGADYEWTAHEPIGRRAGLGKEQLDRVRNGDWPDGLDGRQAASLAYTDRMTSDVRVPDEDFDALQEFFDEQQILELTATVASYNLVSRVLVALEVVAADREPQG